MRELELMRQNRRGRAPSITYPIALLGEMQKDGMKQALPEVLENYFGSEGRFLCVLAVKIAFYPRDSGETQGWGMAQLLKVT